MVVAKAWRPAWAPVSGACLHVGAAALGLSLLLAQSATAFSLVKYVGAAYLVYLGIRLLESPGRRLQALRSSPAELAVRCSKESLSKRST